MISHTQVVEQILEPKPKLRVDNKIDEVMMPFMKSPVKIRRINVVKLWNVVHL